MDFRMVLGLWAAAVAPLPVLLLLGRGFDRALLWSIRWGLALLLFAPLVITVDTVFPFIVGKALVTRGIIEIVFGMWVILAVRNREYRPVRSWVTLLFAAFIIASLVAAFTGVSFTRSFWSNFERMQGVFDLAHWFALFVVVLNVVREGQQWRIVLNIIVGVGLVSALIDVAQRFDVRVIPLVTRTDRVSGTVGNATYVGAQMAVVAMIALGLLADSLMRRRREGAGQTAADHTATEQAATSDAAALTVKTGNANGGCHLVQALVTEPERHAIWPVVYVSTWALVWPAIAGGANPLLVVMSAIGVSALVTLVLLTGRERLLWAITAVVAVWMLTESGSRGAAAALAAGLVTTAAAYAIWAADRRLRVIAAMLGGAIVASVVAFGVLIALAREVDAVRILARTNPLTERMVGEDELPDQARTEVARSPFQAFLDRSRTVSARSAIQGWLERPVAGWGPENFTVIFRRYQRASDFEDPPQSLDQTHSKPLEVLSTTGFLGFVPYMALWGLLLWLAVVRIRRNTSSFHLNVFLGGTLVAYFVHLLFLFETANTLLLFVALASWAAGTERALLSRPVHPNFQSSSATDVRTLERPGELNWPGIRDRSVSYGVPVIIAVGLLLSFVGIHYRVYRAAYLLIRPVPLHRVEAVLDTFPQLGTMGRIAYADSMVSRLASLAPEERAAVVHVFSAELDKAIATEPYSFTVRVVASRFFAAATPFQSDLMTRAREETEQALLLGPSTHEAQARAVEQAFLERDIEAVRSAVDIWKTSHPGQWTRYDERVKNLSEELERERAPGGN